MKIAVAAAALVLLLVPASAEAQSWRQVTASDGASIDQVGHVRTADGVLHLAWHKGGDLFHTAIAANGRVGATVPIQTGWTGHMDAAITSVPSGLYVFWGALRSTDSADPQREINLAFSSDGGRSWGLRPGPVNPGGAQSYGSDVSATTLPNGTSLQAFAGTLGTWVHAGLTPETPNTNFQAPFGNYGNFPGIAAQANGQAMMAWFSSADARRGVLAQAVNANGTPSGPVMTMPGSTVMVGGGTVARTPIVARARSGGFFVGYGIGYPTSGEVRVWKVGSASTMLLDETTTNAPVTVAADPKGRIWAVWNAGTFGDVHVMAARSNRDATEFGAAVDTGAVRDAHSAYSLDANATSSALDVLALFGTGSTSGGSTYIKRINPGLSLDERHRRTRFTFSVTDAGDPVRGATVKVGSRSGKTDRNGRVVLTVTNRRLKATATAKGYEKATLELPR